jgi:hypothetical protein
MEIAERAFPIHRLGLATDEYYFAVKGKMRPAIVITGGEVQWAVGMKEKIFLCSTRSGKSVSCVLLPPTKRNLWNSRVYSSL